MTTPTRVGSRPPTGTTSSTSSQGASTDEIRDAWRAAIADLTPADRRFRLYNQAGEVLLDPERRAAHDADLAAEQPRPPARPASGVTRRPRRRPGRPVATPARRRREADAARRPAVAGSPWCRPGRSAVAGVLAALVAGLTVYLRNQPSEEDVDGRRSPAPAVPPSGRSVPLLSYDYRELDQTEQAAHDVMTSDYRERYDQLFAVIEENAPSTRTVVRAEKVAAAVVRADDAGDRVEVLVFVDQARTNRAESEPEVFRNQARLTMQRVDGEWLVDDVVTSPARAVARPRRPTDGGPAGPLGPVRDPTRRYRRSA